MSSPTPGPLPRDFPDRAIRDALARSPHLRALLRRVLPEFAERLDYSRLEIVPRTYLMDDWRERELDVLVRLPLLGGEPAAAVLVCILIEHQTSADPVTPLRLLLYAVLYWEKEWRAWEQGHAYAEPLRLTPILPVVFHTGQQVWNSHRSLAELFAGPDEVRAWAPLWPAHWFDLPEHTAADLLQGEAWWQAMAVVRAERADTGEFTGVLQEALRRLQDWAQQDRVDWQQLVKLVLHWALFRRPRREHAALLTMVRASLANAELLREVETMAEQVEQTWEQELLAQGEERGERQGALKMLRKVLRKRLEQRFATLPQSVLQRLEAADLAALENALDQADTIPSLDELRF
jgi:Putative transposase, YhgA-like